MVNYGLKDKVAIITGANNPQGIGVATALAFAREGAKVVLVYKKLPRPFDPAKTGENGVDRYFAANAGGAFAQVPTIAGIGTVITAFFMGPLIQFFNTHVAEPMLKK